MEQMVKIYTGKYQGNSAFNEVKKDSERLLKKKWYILQTESSTVVDFKTEQATLQVMVVYRRKG